MKRPALDRLDREPFWRDLEDAVEGTAHDLRNRPGSRLKRTIPPLENRNFGGGRVVGALEAGVAIILQETVGLPLGSDVEVVDTEPAQGGTAYTINVDAPTRNMAETEAFFEAGVGFTSLLTDLIEVESTEVLRTRIVRDTYQIEVLVED